MFKILVIGLLVCHEVYEISGETKIKSMYDTPIPSLSVATVSNIDKKTPDLGGIHIHGANPTFYINSSPPAWKWPRNWINPGNEIRPDYIMTIGNEAHKIHRLKVSWNMARQICVDEGGHLAVIRTEDESKAIRSLMVENSVDVVWVGFHDLFQEGNWVTVLDEPLAKIEWDPWSKKMGHDNPNNASGNENCAAFELDKDGINDDNCAKSLSFVCKMTLSYN